MKKWINFFFLSFFSHKSAKEGARRMQEYEPDVIVAVGGGSCSEFIPQAIALGCDTFVTSDLKYITEFIVRASVAAAFQLE